MRTSLISLVIALLIPVCVAANASPAQTRAGDLDKTPITAGPLKIRIAKLKEAAFLGIGSGSIEVDVENTSTAFETFSPQRLSLINKDSGQVNIVAAKRNRYWATPPYDPRVPTIPLDVRIAPGARFKESYSLSGKVRLPIKLYYDEKLLAEIVE